MLQNFSINCKITFIWYTLIGLPTTPYVGRLRGGFESTVPHVQRLRRGVKPTTPRSVLEPIVVNTNKSSR